MSFGTFSITFAEPMCGLEILFHSLTNEFFVGSKYHTDTAKQFASILTGAQIVTVNGKSTRGMTRLMDIQRLFEAVAEGEKVVVFKGQYSDEQVAAMKKFERESAQFSILGIERFELGQGQYLVTLKTRPLGFTVSAAPSGDVQVVQVDSVQEEDIKLGSKLISINRKQVEEINDAIKLLLKCPMPLTLVLELATKENLFAPEMKEESDVPSWLALSGNDGDMVELNVHWFDKDIKKEDFILLIKADATVAEIRAKIAVTSQLKFNAVKLISKGALLKDDGQKLCDLKFQGSEKVTVVVSHSTQMRVEEKVDIDYKVQMRIMGAFLNTCDKTMLDYLWEDIDYPGKGLLHVTELDRLVQRFMGLYERATCIHVPIEYKHGTVAFNSAESLGLVIEGNEVIMCNPESQAEKMGISAGWQVVGAEYKDKANRMIKFPVDHRSCLQSLKRAKTECADNCFSILCLIPTGDKYETMTIMKKQAIAVLKLDDPMVQSTLTRKNYEQLPYIFAEKAVRISFLDKLEPSAFCKITNSETGAVISKEVGNPQLKSYIGSCVLSINGQTVCHITFGDIMKLLVQERKYHTITLDQSP